jgi:antitoxin component YwqK of YwqJK toxin-antitoxin module
MYNQLEQKYSSSEEYVFKSCFKEWIVVLKKLPNTKTNESRFYVVSSQYAKFRADKLLVVDIVHKFTDQTINEIENSVYRERTIKYTKGEIATVLDFDENLNQVCSTGIHYFKNAEAAFYYELDGVENGPYKKWYENGQLNLECAYKNGKKNGLYKLLRSDDQPEVKCAYKNGELDGEYKKWNENGQLKLECTYNDGKLDGLYKVWYENGQLKTEYTCKDGYRDGLYKEWHWTGKLLEEYTHKDGIKISNKALHDC